MPVKAQAILIGVLVVVCAIAAVFGYRSVDNMLHPQATLTNSVVARQLEKIQDLTTAKETDFGFEEYKEGNIAPRQIVLEAIRQRNQRILPHPEIRNQPLQLLDIPSLIQPNGHPHSPSFALPSQHTTRRHVMGSAVHTPMTNNASADSRRLSTQKQAAAKSNGNHRNPTNNATSGAATNAKPLT